jgi:hypothetical protein
MRTCRKGWFVLAACAAGAAWVVACGGDGGGGTDVIEAGPETSETETGPVEGSPCDDGDPCTKDDRIRDGGCAGVAYECKGGSPYCLVKACDGQGGCIDSVQSGLCLVDGACYAAAAKDPDNNCRGCTPTASQTAWTPIVGSAGCSDGDACTQDDHCQDGECKGTAVSCDDNNVCTDDSCDAALGCLHTDKAGTCDDGDACTTGDTCSGGKCQPGAVPLDCEDGNECTVDTCDPATGCVNEVSPEVACDDHNPCTTASCDASKDKCVNTAAPNGTPCEDGDLCSGADICMDAACTPGPAPTVCEDDNDCTADSCHADVGCVHTNVTGACDDGFDCTINDTCVAGKCSGKKTLDCGICIIANNQDANKVVTLKIGESGHPGQGLDLDANPLTCAPEGNCSGGIDNELGILAAFVNPGLQQSLKDGYLTYVLEFVDFAATGTFTVGFANAGLAESNPTCDFQAAQCDWVPFQEALDADCKTIVSFDNAKLDGTKLTAGGPSYTFAMQASLIGGATMVIGITHARIEAAATLDSEGRIHDLDGTIGGGVAKAELMDTLSKLPDYVFPMPKKDVLDMLDTVIVNDLDVDADGTPDVASVNIRFTTIPANIVAGP